MMRSSLGRLTSAVGLLVFFAACHSEPPSMPIVSQTPTLAQTPPPTPRPPPKQSRVKLWNGEMPCECEHLPSLEQDLRNANTILDRFKMARSEGEVAGLSDDDARDRFAAIVKELNSKTQAPFGVKGLGAVTTVLEGQDQKYDDVINEIKEKSAADLALCEMSKALKDQLADAKKGSVCRAMAEAIQRHEETHVAFCRKIGFRRYSASSVTSVENEISAYTAEIDFLTKEIKALHKRCRRGVIARNPTPTDLVSFLPREQSYHQSTDTILFCPNEDGIHWTSTMWVGEQRLGTAEEEFPDGIDKPFRKIIIPGMGHFLEIVFGPNMHYHGIWFTILDGSEIRHPISGVEVGRYRLEGPGEVWVPFESYDCQPEDLTRSGPPPRDRLASIIPE